MEFKICTENPHSCDLVSRVASFYFKTKPFEKDMYEKLGVRGMKELVLKLSNRSRKNEYKGSNWFIGYKLDNSSLKWFANATKYNEAVHLIGASVITMGAASYYISGYSYSAGVLLTMNIANIIPIVIQRYNRGRIDHIFNKRKRGLNPS